MLELQNVNKFYTNNDITNLGLRNINLKFNLGEIVAITGDSGSGKSTLLNVIAKLDTFDEGEIYYKGNETAYFSIKDMDDFRKNKIGFIFQNYNIIDSYTVLENVMVPLLLKGINKKDAKEKAKILIDKVGLHDKLRNRGSKLSGGEKQRCVIARALASDCEILICDEPTGNLDSKTTKEIVNLIKEVSHDKLVLIVTHNFEDFQDIVTRKIVMQDGEVIDDIYYQKLPADSDVNLELDYVPLKQKIKFKIAKNNILFTPKRSFFILIVFLCISLFNIFLFHNIISTYDTINYYNSYRNKQDNRLYIYNINNQTLEPEKINKLCDKTITNSFYEDISLIISDEKTELFYAYYNQYIDDYKIKKGTLPQNDNEIFVVFPSDMLNENYYSYDRIVNSINKFVNITTYDDLDDDEKDNSTVARSTNKYKITGYGENKKIENCIIFGTSNLEKQIKEYLKNFTIEIDNQSLWNNENSQFINYTTLEEDSNVSFKIYLPKNYDIEKCIVNITMNDLYKITDYEIYLHEDDTNKIQVNYYPETFEKNQVFEMSAYTKNPAKLQKQIINLGYLCDIVKTYNQNTELEVIFGNILKYLAIISSAFNLIIIFFITYFILSKVYNSKKNDYQILRILGITKNDMSKIVIYEIFILAAISWLLALIIYILITKGLIFDSETLLIFLITSIIFAYALAKRFNKRLFKFSVSKSLKDGE